MGITSSKSKLLRRKKKDTGHVNPVRHQAVLSDHISPISTLSAVISIPRSSCWRKSVNTGSTYSLYDEEEDDALSTPRTSVGSSQKDNIYESRHEDTTQPSKPFWTHHLNDEKEYDR